MKGMVRKYFMNKNVLKTERNDNNDDKRIIMLFMIIKTGE